MIELKSNVINMKSLDQDIDDPIVVGGGDSNGRSLKVIFTQEAAARFTSNTRPYLSWYNQASQVRGLNVFRQIKKDPMIWEIHFPESMLTAGDVLACIKLIDDISISCSVNFIIHVIADPDDGNNFIYSDDYNLFKDATINMNSASTKAKELLKQIQDDYGLTKEELMNLMQENIEILDKLQNEEPKIIIKNF